MVSSAYNCLSNENEKKRYDKLGHEIYTNQKNPNYRSSEASHQHHHQRRGYYYEDDLSPEDLFEMIFNPHRRRNFQRNNVYTYNFGTRMNNHRNVNNNNNQNSFPYLQLIAFLLMFFFLFSGSIFRPKAPPFSLDKGHYHRYKLTTFNRKLDFFVNEELEDYISQDKDKRSREVITKLQVSVESEWRSYLDQVCGEEIREYQFRKIFSKNAQKNTKGCDMRKKYFGV